MTATSDLRAVIFDLDGTLLDTVVEIHAALAGCLGELGVPAPTAAVTRDLVGHGVRSLVERALARQAVGDAADLDLALAAFERHYAQVVTTAAAPYPGALEGMRRLRDAGLPLAVATNKPRAFTERLLDATGLAPLLAAVVAGDDGHARKPAGDMLRAACAQLRAAPAQTLMVGDSDTDVQAARAAGCPVWCVPYGYNEGRAPETLACDRLVESVDAIARLVIG